MIESTLVIELRDRLVTLKAGQRLWFDRTSAGRADSALKILLVALKGTPNIGDLQRERHVLKASP